MKKHRILSVIFSAAAALVLTVMCAGLTVSAAKVGDDLVTSKMTYRVTSSDTVMTTKYTGKSKSVKVPAAVKSGGKVYTVNEIGDFTFENNANIISVKLPDSIEAIGQNAFYSCTKLRTVNIPDGVVSIEDGAFMFCGKLEDIELPDTLDYLGCAFSNCESLTSINIPGSVKTVKNSTFSGCTYLKEVTIEKGVKTIENGAFGDCYSLEEITFPSSVKSVGFGVFCNCNSLFAINMPKSVKTLDDDFLYGCHAQYIKFPKDGVNGKFAVNFEAGSDEPVYSQIVKKGAKVKKPETPERYGYKFVGWYTDEACTKAYDFKNPVKGNLTLYAKWK